MATDPFLLALRQADRSGSHPNPTVGAVVTDENGEIIGSGTTDVWPGTTHAEVAALAEAGEGGRGGTLYVTLEPCNHHGRTPPCTEAIIAAGISRVVVGAIDPDPRVAGTAIEHLRHEGIEVQLRPDPETVERLDPAYFHHRRTGRTHVTLKMAMTLDGQVAARDGTSQWITSPEGRSDAHRLRSQADAVVIGAGTQRADDPELTVRLDGFAGAQPRAVVIAGNDSLPPRARLWNRPDTLVYSTKHIDIPAEVVIVDRDAAGLVDPVAVVADLGARDVVATLIEGGPTLATSFVAARVVDVGVTYLGASLAGGIGIPAIGGAWATFADRRPVVIDEVTMVGPDARIQWHPIQE